MPLQLNSRRIFLIPSCNSSPSARCQCKVFFPALAERYVKGCPRASRLRDDADVTMFATLAVWHATRKGVKLNVTLL